MISRPYTTRLSAVLALALALTACGQKAPDARPAARPALTLSAVDVRHAQSGRVDDAVPVTGPISARVQTTLAAELEGTVTAIHVREGEAVKKGQLLAEIDPRTASLDLDEKAAQLAANRARLDLARKKLQRQRELAAQGFISPNALDEFESDYRVNATQLAAQESILARARKSLADSRIVAPFDGVIYKRSAEVGQTLPKNGELFGLAALRDLEVAASVPARDIERIRLGQLASLTLDSGLRFDGRVTRINPVADSGTRSYTVFIAVDNRDGRIYPGQYARGRLVITSADATAILPLTAIRDRDGKAPWVMTLEGKRAVKRPVTIGLIDTIDGLAAVSGLPANAVAIYDHVLGVRPGDTVALIR